MMRRAEVADLLTHIAAFDHRTVGTTELETWFAVVGDLTFADAVEAVDAHYRRDQTWLTPAEVATAVRRIRRQRLDHAGRAPLPTVDPDDVPAWLVAHRAQLAAIANGHPIATSHQAANAALTTTVEEVPQP